jgi:hypothetical protein
MVASEAALKSSVGSEAEARLEIEMSRCGVFLICTETELIKLFRRNCPSGRIVFVKTASSGTAPKAVDYVVEEIKFRRIPMKKLFGILFVEPGFGWVAITIFGSVYVLYAQTGFWLN